MDSLKYTFPTHIQMEPHSKMTKNSDEDDDAMIEEQRRFLESGAKPSASLFRMRKKVHIWGFMNIGSVIFRSLKSSQSSRWN